MPYMVQPQHLGGASYYPDPRMYGSVSPTGAPTTSDAMYVGIPLSGPAIALSTVFLFFCGFCGILNGSKCERLVEQSQSLMKSQLPWA